MGLFMDLREALTQISEIRQQVARTETFRGYRAAPVAFSGTLAVLAALVQNTWLPNPAEQLSSYLTLWVGAALLSMAVMGVYLGLHCWRSSLTLARSDTALAVGQFLPCVVAGGLLTVTLCYRAPETLWMLPGLWSMLFGLGIFGSWHLLPRSIFWVGVHYLGCGVFCLVLAQGEQAYAPWAMGVPFGVGQLMAAGILYWALERNHGEK